MSKSEWFMPDEYKAIDVQNWVLNKCTTDKEIARVR